MGKEKHVTRQVEGGKEGDYTGVGIIYLIWLLGVVVGGGLNVKCGCVKS